MDEAFNELDIRLYFDDELIAGIVLDDVQDTYPWYQGVIVDGPALGRWRTFAEAYHHADLEFDYCPHHPHEGSYDETDLAAYVGALTELHQTGQTKDACLDDDGWLTPWTDAQPEQLEGYLRFLDFRRWRAVARTGEIAVEIPLPPSLDLTTRRFSFRVSAS
ncbi:hypothetical protein [Nonomuraea sp. NPDC049400]|uniref:hypothetical protein n=1 Tax=Nonomuraea sp. NPDC049400 TaxID=3364352 RepID=UPI0037AC5801